MTGSEGGSVSVTRREFLVRTGAAALLAAGPYGRIEGVVRRTVPGVGVSTRPRGSLPAEQHLFEGLTSVTDHGTVVTVPPLHHMVVTATLATGSGTAALQHARQTLESALAGLEESRLLDFRPSGLGLAVAWGLPYFRRLPSSLGDGSLPVDVAASQRNQQTTYALLDAVTFASDPPGTILEQNDVAFVFASDHLDHISEASDTLFNGPAGILFTITSIRKGFVDGRKLRAGGRSVTKQMAVQAGVPGAAQIPESAELFLGFTSTQQAALGPSVVANFETLPQVTDQWPNGYFANGTTMHLSHIFEDLVAWYDGTYAQRAGAAFSPAAGRSATPGTLTLPEGPAQVESLAQLQADVKDSGFVGHSSSMQPVSRLASTTTDNYGNTWPAGTALPQRADFNTLDNPFFFSADPKTDHMASGAAAGVHFVAYVPTSTSFAALRQAMDGQYRKTSLGAAAVHGPFNQVLRTTHRQNFLVPPRSHRSFPLAELLT